MRDRNRYVRVAVACWLVFAAAAGAWAEDGAGREPEPVLIDRERLSDPGPPAFTISRPDREWLFVDIERQQAELAKTLPARTIEERFRGLVGRFHHLGLEATISVYVFPYGAGAPKAGAPLVERALAELSARAGVRVLEAGPFVLRGRPAAWVEYEIESPDADGERRRWRCVRIDCPFVEAERLFVLFLEVPPKYRKAGRADLKKLVRSLRWRA